ncbi:cell wall protein AWA1-like isoform X2 [Xenopus laevis]|uniref:Cell wall protein AWA1-like isoform X2 n=1 Tax=Xenopus laevis TaxID=8355 RepID=A0A8J0TAJ3_XENLA|nr:cell wall protein AWA1-like isoform X2 [Xenopus laevis]
MKFPLGLVSFIIAFAAVAMQDDVFPTEPLLCTECKGETFCTGTSIKCASEEYCISWYIEETNDGNKTKMLIRSCAPIEQCDFSASINSTGGSIKMVSSCCNSDNCTPHLPPLPSDSNQLLEITCPTCTNSEFNFCNSEDTMRCSGKESRCIEYSSLSGNSTKAVRGCATRSSCGPDGLDGPEPLTLNIGGFNFTFNCSDAEIDSPISCAECKSSDSSSCTGTNVTCASGYVCTTHHKVVIQDGDKTQSIVRTCGAQSNCEDLVRQSLPGYTAIDSTTCCYSNYCTPAIKSYSSQTNGLICTTCTAENGNACDNEKTMECSGDENVCHAELTLLSDNSKTVSGCATKSICDRIYSTEDATVSYTCQIPKAANITMSIESTTTSVGIVSTGNTSASVGTVHTGIPTSSVGIVSTGNTTSSVGIVSTGNTSASVGTVHTGIPTSSVGIVSTGNTTSSVGIVSTGNTSASVGTVHIGITSSSVGSISSGNTSASVGTVHIGNTSEGITNTTANLGNTVRTTGRTIETTKTSSVLANAGNTGVPSASTKISSRSIRTFVGVFVILYMYFVL